MKKELKHLKTFKQNTDKNLNISDVSDSYYVFYFNAEKVWIQSTREAFTNITDAKNYIGDKQRLKVFKMIE